MWNTVASKMNIRILADGLKEGSKGINGVE
jgi:hypothetical protein